VPPSTHVNWPPRPIHDVNFEEKFPYAHVFFLTTLKVNVRSLAETHGKKWAALEKCNKNNLEWQTHRTSQIRKMSGLTQLRSLGFLPLLLLPLPVVSLNNGLLSKLSLKLHGDSFVCMGWDFVQGRQVGEPDPGSSRGPNLTGLSLCFWAVYRIHSVLQGFIPLFQKLRMLGNVYVLLRSLSP
jgi:hypothetical protein